MTDNDEIELRALQAAAELEALLTDKEQDRLCQILDAMGWKFVCKDDPARDGPLISHGMNVRVGATMFATNRQPF
jgi:hypothetical protein